MFRTKKIQVSFFVDGSFLPIRNGTNYSIYHLMNALSDTGAVNPSLLMSYRGWDDPKDYFGQKFKAIFVRVDDYYNDTGVLECVARKHNLQVAHVYNAEEVMNMGLRLKKAGVKIIYEVINIDHVLCSQLGGDVVDIEKVKSLQKRACDESDWVMCRSEVDKKHLIDMGVIEDKISVYRGAIDTSSIEFKPRRIPRHKLLFLGHMYYPPNEEALKLIVKNILPKLMKINPRYTVTVVGNTPALTMKKYKTKGLVFKGGQNDLSELLGEYDLGIAPLYQGSGTRLKILDYLASGLRVITTSLGVEGLDVKILKYVNIENDIDNYASEIEKMMGKIKLGDSLPRLGRRFVEKEYNWKRSVTPFVKVYQKLA